MTQDGPEQPAPELAVPPGSSPVGGGATSWAHYCGRCGKGTPFGYSTKRGTIWACDDHRALAEALLEADGPGAMR